jgi:hypothetical protein
VIGPALLLTGGSLVLASGVVLLGLANDQFNRALGSDCAKTGTCPQAIYQTWDTREKIGWALSAVGAAALLSSAVWALVTIRAVAKDRAR